MYFVCLYVGDVFVLMRVREWPLEESLPIGSAGVSAASRQSQSYQSTLSIAEVLNTHTHADTLKAIGVDPTSTELFERTHNFITRQNKNKPLSMSSVVSKIYRVISSCSVTNAYFGAHDVNIYDMMI